MRTHFKKTVSGVCWTAVKTLVAVMMFFPIVWIASSGFKTLVEVSQFPPSILPAQPQWSNFSRILGDGFFYKYLLNTVLLMAGTAAGTLISSSLVAFLWRAWSFPARMCFSP